jgi:hypothetical protein
MFGWQFYAPVTGLYWDEDIKFEIIFVVLIPGFLWQ